MKSVSSRNLIGGFLGGTLGILLSWFVSPLALPFGVLLGVIIGWWNEDIVHLLGEGREQARKKARGLVVGATGWVRSVFPSFCSLTTEIPGVFRWIVTKAIVGSVVAIVLSLKRFWQWQSSHPMNRAHAISVTTILLFVWGLCRH
jgi:hypothetical protein